MDQVQQKYQKKTQNFQVAEVGQVHFDALCIKGLEVLHLHVEVLKFIEQGGYFIIRVFSWHIFVKIFFCKIGEEGGYMVDGEEYSLEVVPHVHYLDGGYLLIKKFDKFRLLVFICFSFSVAFISDCFFEIFFKVTIVLL